MIRIFKNIKTPNWRIIGIEKNMEIETKGIKNIFNEIVTENSSHIRN